MSPDPRTREVIANAISDYERGKALNARYPLPTTDAILAALDAAGLSVVQLEQVTTRAIAAHLCEEGWHGRWDMNGVLNLRPQAEITARTLASLDLFRVIADRSPINEEETK